MKTINNNKDKGHLGSSGDDSELRVKNEERRTAKASIMRELAPYASLGTQMVLTILVGAYIGWWLDGKYDTGPWFLIILTFFGAFAGMVTFIRTVTKRKKQ